MIRSLAWIQRLPTPSPLLLALLIAAGLHAIVLAAFRAHPAAPHPRLSNSDDNSPELVRLSRQQASEAARVRSAATPLSLPAFSSLPLPRWNDIPDRHSSSAKAERSPSGGDDEPQAKAVGTPNCPETGGGRSRQTNGTGTGREGLLTVLAKLQTLARENPGRGMNAEGLPPLLWPQAETRVLWSRWWESATAVPGKELEIPSAAGVELRRISLSRARSLGYPTDAPRRQAAVINDHLLLIWPQGDQLWLLQSSLARTTEAEPPSP